MSAIKLELRGVSQSYPRPGDETLHVIKDVNLSITEPGIHMILGPSGCGKSTLLRMMGGVRPFNVTSPTEGEVLIDGVPCHGAHDDAVMVFQHYANRPDLSVWDNVAFPFRLGLWKRRVAESDWRERVARMLEEVGLADKRSDYPQHLSGGQNQRLALARALVLRPRILLMDEPFGALDAQTRAEMQQLLMRLHASHPCLVLFVTHDVTEALVLGDHIHILSTQPARIVRQISVNALRPRSREWLGSDGRRVADEILTLLSDAHSPGNVRVSV